MLAHYGNDKAFMDLIHKGYDIHKGTASLLFHVPYEEVTDDQRSKGKTTNFGLVYGLGNASFAKALGHDIDESIYRTATKYLYEKYRPWDIMQYREPVCYVMTAEQAIAELDEKIITRIAKEQKIEDVNKYREELIKAIEYFFSEPIKEAILDAQKTKNDYFNRFPGIKQFIKEAKAAGFENLKGHRTVGGMRASIYNAMPIEGVKALVDFMKDFEERNLK